MRKNHLLLAAFIFVAVGIPFFLMQRSSMSDLTGAAGKNPLGAFTLSSPKLSCADGTSQVLLSWGSSANAISYVVQRKVGKKGAWKDISPVLAGTTYIDASVVVSPTAYDYRVLAGNDRTAKLSNVVSIVVSSCSASSSSASSISSSSSRSSSSSLSSRSSSSLISSSLASSAASSRSSSSSNTPVSKIWGAYVGWRIEDGATFESRVGKPMMNRATFVHWGNENEFPSYLAPSLAGKTLTIFWEATDYNDPSTNQTRFSYAAILRGDWDAYITSFAAQAQAYGRPVILIPFEEMNGDWYTWSGSINGNTAADHIAAYRYLRGFFRDVPNVKFGWAVNHESVPNTQGNSIAAYYPGSDVVDYVGVDGFNNGNPWITFDQIFGAALAQLKPYGKPVYIFSMASAQSSSKAAWITDALVTQMARHPEVTGWIWFNENKERDWRVWSDDASLQAFRAALP